MDAQIKKCMVGEMGSQRIRKSEKWEVGQTPCAQTIEPRLASARTGIRHDPARVLPMREK